VIRFGLRLTIAGGREAAARLVMISAAVAVGVALLLATLAGANAVNRQNDRWTWLNTGNTEVTKTVQSISPLWWDLRYDYFDGQDVGRIDVAATGPDSPVPPGIPRLPGPGEYYASSELAKLLDKTPSLQLGDRFGQDARRIGILPDSMLPAPDSLLVVVGQRPEAMEAMAGATKVTSILDKVPPDCRCITGINADGMKLVLSVVALAFLFPVLMFIGTATRLSAARREQRFAAMRLVGATPRQISVISTVESTVAAVIGTVIGFTVFLLLRDPLASVPFTGSPFFPDDLALNLWDVLGVAVGVPVGAAIAARIALRRVQISPLGVTRRVRPKPPRAYRLLLLAAGLAELTYFLQPGRRPPTGTGQVAAYLPGFLLIMAGLVVAGPWLTMVGSRVLARRSKRPATLIAARRLADDPKAAFRAISGLTLALFVTTVAVGVITTITTFLGTPSDSGASTLSKLSFPDQGPVFKELPGGLAADLSAIPGVTHLTVVRLNPGADHAPFGQYGENPGLISCTDLAKVPNHGRCESGATVASVYPDFTGFRQEDSATTVWPAATAPPDILSTLPILGVIVDTDGSTAAIESARTVLEMAFPSDHRIPNSDRDLNTQSERTLASWQQLASVVILTTLPIAGCSLAVSIIGGLADRKRPFSLLRLTGVPLRSLRNVVALESAAPLLVSAAVAVGTGLLAAHLFLRSQMQYSLQPLGAEYYVIVVVGLLASLGIIASTLPLLRRITGPETARNE
jgi:FtsX-like permease family